MRRILLLLVGVASLMVSTTVAARSEGHAAEPAYLVVRNASADGGVAGKPIVTVVVRGFVLGRVAQEGAVEAYHLASSTGSIAAQATGVDVSRRAVSWRGVPGTEFSGSGFRFRAVGGVWRVVVYGSGVSLYAGGEASRITLHGSATYPTQDGEYSLDGGPFVSLPSGVVSPIIEAK